MVLIGKKPADIKATKPMQCDLISFFPLKFDAQLMVSENNVDEWSRYAKKMGFDRIIPQVESISEPEKFEALAMDMHSPVAVGEPHLSKLKYVLVMAVEPGFGGQKFVEAAINDVRELVKIRREKGYKYLIGVDGGIGKEHLAQLEETGADEVAVGAKRVISW